MYNFKPQSAVLQLRNDSSRRGPIPPTLQPPNTLLVPLWLMSGGMPPFFFTVLAMLPVVWRWVAQVIAHSLLPLPVAQSGTGMAGAAGSRQREQAGPQGRQHLEERSLRHRRTSCSELWP